jgi:predicted XRE-type DNA-binding protein
MILKRLCFYVIVLKRLKKFRGFGFRPPITRVPRAQARLEDDMNNKDITHGTGNVYADLGFPDATERQTKTRLAFALNELLKSRSKLKQREVAELLDIPQPKVSALKNYRLDNFSVERLMEFLTALDQDVEIMIRPRANSTEAGHISVLAMQ